VVGFQILEQEIPLLWQNEELNKQVTKYVRENNGERKPHMTLCSFCHWINEALLQQNVLDRAWLSQENLTRDRKDMVA